MEQIPIAGPWITEKEIAYVTDAVTNAWYKDAYIYHDRFEKAFCGYVGRAHAMTLPSCTSGLHMALMALGIGVGDEVIVPDATWIATAAPICYVGATPVFADIEKRSWCLSAKAFEDAITPRTKAVIFVDLYGSMPEIDAILAIAKARGIAVIEDAAEAMGSEFRGRKAGAFGDVSVFSFHGSKTLTTGEGGMLVTDRQDIYDQCIILRDHGRVPGDKMFWNAQLGYKYRMTSMQAALGLAQLERIDELVARKRDIFEWYKSAFDGVFGITLNDEPQDTRNSYWMVTAILDARLNLPKETVVAKLNESGIDARPFFYPLSELPVFRETPEGRAARHLNTVAYDLSNRGINLPSGYNMTRAKVEFVAGCLKALIDTASVGTGSDAGRSAEFLDQTQ